MATLTGYVSDIVVRYSPSTWHTSVTVQTDEGPYIADHRGPNLAVRGPGAIKPGDNAVIELPTRGVMATLLSWTGAGSVEVQRPNWEPDVMPSGMHSLEWDSAWGAYAAVWEDVAFVWVDQKWDIRGITDESYCVLAPDCPPPPNRHSNLMWVPEVGWWMATINRRPASFHPPGSWALHDFDPRPVCPRARLAEFYEDSYLNAIVAVEDMNFFKALDVAGGVDASEEWLRCQYPTVWDHLLRTE